MIDEYDRPIYDNPKIDEWDEVTDLVAKFIRIFDHSRVKMLLIFGRYRFPMERIRFNDGLFEVGVEDDPNPEMEEQGEMFSAFTALENFNQKSQDRIWRQVIGQQWARSSRNCAPIWRHALAYWMERSKNCSNPINLCGKSRRKTGIMVSRFVSILNAPSLRPCILQSSIVQLQFHTAIVGDQ